MSQPSAKELDAAFRLGSSIWISQVKPTLLHHPELSPQELRQAYAGLILAGLAGLAADFGPDAASVMAGSLVSSFVRTCQQRPPSSLH